MGLLCNNKCKDKKKDPLLYTFNRRYMYTVQYCSKLLPSWDTRQKSADKELCCLESDISSAIIVFLVARAGTTC